MVRALLDEARRAPLDDAGRRSLKEIHERSIHELEEILSPDLRQELADVTLPFSSDTPSDAELRIAQAQLVGWLEGLFHGIQATLFTQQMQAQRQFEEMRDRRVARSRRSRRRRAHARRVPLIAMTAPVPLGNFDWEPASWRRRAAAHQPDWPDAAALERVDRRAAPHAAARVRGRGALAARVARAR